MTSLQLYAILLSMFEVEKKQDKRKVYDTLLREQGITTKQLGGLMSVLSRKQLATLDKTTLTLHEMQEATE